MADVNILSSKDFKSFIIILFGSFNLPKTNSIFLDLSEDKRVILAIVY